MLESGFASAPGAHVRRRGIRAAGVCGPEESWGTFSLGNQLDMTEEFVFLYNISAWGSGYAIHQGDFDRMNGDRLPNSVKFLSNDFAGFKFGGMCSFGNQRATSIRTARGAWARTMRATRSTSARPIRS